MQIMGDAVRHPDHYTSINGIECIEVTREFNFCLGNAIKYIWRAGRKDPEKYVEDLRKAIQYLLYEISRVERTLGVEATNPTTGEKS